MQKKVVSSLENIFLIAHDEEAKEIGAAKKSDKSLATSLTPSTADAMASSLLHLATENENRGQIVQQRGVQLLLILREVKTEKEKCAERATLALARICISINPSLFSVGLVYSLVSPFLWLLRKSEHELITFETLMALTNLAAMNDEELRDKIITEKGWSEISYQMTMENPQVQRAALEALTNLLYSEKAIARCPNCVFR